jgi:cell division septation protein DedD
MNDDRRDDVKGADGQKERRLEPLADDFADWDSAAEDEYTDEFDEFDEFDDIEAFDEDTGDYAGAAGRSDSTDYGGYDNARDRGGDALNGDASDYAQVEEDDWEEASEAEPPAIPWGLVAAGVLAIILVAAGGYGVMQDRAAMQEEIRRLQASLATATAPEETQASRASLRELEQTNSDLRTTIDVLETENRSLRETVAGLESQLDTLLKRENGGVPAPGEPTAAATKAAPADAVAPGEPAVVAPTPPVAAPPAAAAPAPPAPAAEAEKPASASRSDGEWFVNFGSYSREGIAREWAGRLKVDSGDVVVTTAQRNGATFYRVRVTGLVSREQAEGVARTLEQRHGLERLWVGRE